MRSKTIPLKYQPKKSGEKEKYRTVLLTITRARSAWLDFLRRFRTPLKGHVVLRPAAYKLIENRVHNSRSEQNFAVWNGHRRIVSD
jgi:hypothetical protein